jgi:hypothetical protein
MRTITSPNAALFLSISGLYSIPQQIQGFAADDITDFAEVNSSEIVMGVDGKLSGGFVYMPIPQGIALQADSDSNDLFDTWYASQQAAGELFVATGILRLPSVTKTYTMTRGFLTTYKAAPDVKKTLQPRKYTITWQTVLVAPI